jgi:hypothetical protein
VLGTFQATVVLARLRMSWAAQAESAALPPAARAAARTARLAMLLAVRAALVVQGRTLALRPLPTLELAAPKAWAVAT